MSTYLSKTRFYEFHFVMCEDMKKSLKRLALYKETGSLSGVIGKILSFLTPVIEREHKWGEQRMSRYMLVSNDPDEKREHVHAYLPGFLYRRLKLMHQDLNVFSIAQLVRQFLDLFLVLVKKYGNDVFQALKKIFKKWNEEKEKNRLTSYSFIRQLSIILRHLMGQNKLINIYDSHYSPFWVFRL